MQLTATIEREELSDGTPIYVALCRELDIASQGETQSEAVMNLDEAVSLFLENADDAEIGQRQIEISTQPHFVIPRGA